MFNSDQDALMFQSAAAEIATCFPLFAQRNPEDIPDCEVLNQHFGCINANAKPLKFIPQDQHLPYPNLSYEQRIFNHGLIATRKHNWHDFFNAIIWKLFPQSKCAINALHCEEINKQNSSLRSQKRDLLTLFDECGVIVMADDYILQLIQKHQWFELFVEHKQLWLNGHIQLITFGHAMLEKYLNPYIGMTAKALLLENKQTDLDAYLGNCLLDHSLLRSKTDLAPLPLLGVPHWHKNQDPAFYANKQYFR